MMNVFKSLLTKKTRDQKLVFILPSLLLTTYLFKPAKRAFLSSKPEISPDDKRLLVNLPKLEEMEEGEMKEVKWGTKDNQSILVVKFKGNLHALSNYCPHYGAPLHTGVLIDNVVKCPWHGASFDILSGKTDISPSIDDLPVYKVESTDDGDNYVVLPDKNDVKKFITPSMSKRDPNDKRRFVIIGGGPAGLSAAETLRQANYTGEILIISKDPELPYDRTVLSKYVPQNVGTIQLRSSDFLNEYDIDVKTNISINGINNKDKTVQLEDGTLISYDKLLIASGSSPIRPRIPGAGLSHVFTLRTYSDLEKISSSAKNAKNIVIVGGGFIGLETTGMLKKLNPEANVTVVDGFETPFYATLGKEVGAALQKFHENKGIKFALGNNVKSITNESVELINGTTLEADMVLLGTGVVPNSDFLKNSIALEKNFIICDKFLNTSDENIFAAGDVSSVPYFQTGERYSCGHFVNAQQQGSVAALNMLEKNVAYEYVPYFWSRQWDKSIQYTGYGSTWDEVFVSGDLSKLEFVSYYLKNDKIVGFASMGVSNAANIMYEAFRNNKLPSATAIKTGNSDLNKIKSGLKGVKGKCSRAHCICAERRKAAEANRI